jgi:preprotein translocase subunit SecB
MTAQQVNEFKRSTSGNMSNYLALIDLRLKSVAADLIFPSPRKPLELTASVLVDISRLSEFVTYDVKYALGAKDRDERDVLEATITLNLLFKIKDGMNPSEDELRAFGTFGSVDIAHPYMREIVQTLTGRMGLPPLVLDVRAPEPVEL